MKVIRAQRMACNSKRGTGWYDDKNSGVQFSSKTTSVNVDRSKYIGEKRIKTLGRIYPETWWAILFTRSRRDMIYWGNICQIACQRSRVKMRSRKRDLHQENSRTKMTHVCHDSYNVTHRWIALNDVDGRWFEFLRASSLHVTLTKRESLSRAKGLESWITKEKFRLTPKWMTEKY